MRHSLVVESVRLNPRVSGGNDSVEINPMIPPVDKQGLVDALDRFNREFRDSTEYTGWEQNRAHKYAIQEHGRLYPVKQIIHLATGASKRDFNGGAESNNYVEERGFTVVPLRSDIENKIQSSLEAILGSYAELRRSEPFGQNPNLWRAFETIRTHLEQLPSVRARREIKATWSVGQGKWARVPWITLLDQRETTTTQKGVYCVFLFREDMSGVYLTLNQGVTEPKNRLGQRDGLAEVKTRAVELRGLCGELKEFGFRLDNEIDLQTGAGRGQDYESSTVAYKLYEQGAVPVDEDIVEDIEAVLEVYDGYLARSSAAGPNQAELEKLRLEFLKHIPGFESFAEVGTDSAYIQGERSYKDELIQIFNEEIEPRLKAESLTRNEFIDFKPLRFSV